MVFVEPSQVWAVVLAGGDGTRMSSLTRGPTGEPVPKQYCTFGTGEPLLRWALRRAAGVVPRSRILVVVAEQHRPYWRQALFDIPTENVIIQPRNRGTAPGILLPVLDIMLHRDRDARVLVLPSDHHVVGEDVLRRALRTAARTVGRPGTPVVLVDMAGVAGDEEYGWIVPVRRRAGSLRAVVSFVEKPDPEKSRQLASGGALVNSFILAFRTTTLVRLYEDALPTLVREFLPVVGAANRKERVGPLYDAIPSLDFSRAVLERSPGSLGVLACPPCGWSDLGTPSRLERFLERRPRLERAAPAAAAV